MFSHTCIVSCRCGIKDVTIIIIKNNKTSIMANDVYSWRYAQHVHGDSPQVKHGYTLRFSMAV